MERESTPWLFLAVGVLADGLFSKEKSVQNLDISRIVLQYLCLLFSLSVHEAAHAAMANYWGDPTAKLMGRMTLNPVKHADMMGTVLLPLFAMISGFPYLFGWAKPVPFNPRNLVDRRRGPVMIALAGSGSNLLMILFAAIVLRALAAMIGVVESPILLLFIQAFIYLALINMILMLFNLIPLPPLDGHHVLEYFLPPEGQKMLERIGPYSIFILFILVFWLRILTAPMTMMSAALFYAAFYGTPMWEVFSG